MVRAMVRAIGSGVGLEFGLGLELGPGLGLGFTVIVEGDDWAHVLIERQGLHGT